MSVTISGEQRDALYDHILLKLSAFGDLQLALDRGDIETATRLGRRFSDGLRLIQDELGWGVGSSASYELRTIPPAELARILAGIRDDAADEYEAERAEQEEFRANGERTSGPSD
jgi:hypothetical protein